MAGVSRGLGSGCLALFALPFAAVGVGMGWWLFSTLAKCHAATSWAETPARILEVNLRSSRGSKSTTYKCEARYAYVYDGRAYESDRVSFYGGSDNIGSFQRDIYEEISRHRSGGSDVEATYRCYVNPADPREAVLFRGVRAGMAAFQSVFVLAFGGVGFGLLVGALTGGRTERRRRELEQAHPGEPWKWREDWAAGVIRADTRGTVFIACFAVFWNVVSVPLSWMAVTQALKTQHYAALLILLFPLIGALLAWWAVHSVLVTMRFGKAVLRLGAVPGVTGGKLAGIVQLPERLRPEDGFHVTLKCTRTVTTGSGKNRSTQQVVLWEASQDIASDASRNLVQSAIPVLFAIPYDQPSTDPHATAPVNWRLEVSATNPGVDLSVTFKVPVFATAESRPDFRLDDAAIRPYLAKG